jgi:hypothetical protein
MLSVRLWKRRNLPSIGPNDGQSCMTFGSHDDLSYMDSASWNYLNLSRVYNCTLYRILFNISLRTARTIYL